MKTRKILLIISICLMNSWFSEFIFHLKCIANYILELITKYRLPYFLFCPLHATLKWTVWTGSRSRIQNLLPPEPTSCLLSCHHELPPLSLSSCAKVFLCILFHTFGLVNLYIRSSFVHISFSWDAFQYLCAAEGSLCHLCCSRVITLLWAFYKNLCVDIVYNFFKMQAWIEIVWSILL